MSANCFHTFLHALATPEPIKDWPLRSLKDKQGIVAKIINLGRYFAFQMDEVAVTKNPFADILAVDRGTATLSINILSNGV